MKERPILFSAPMVCAILEGRKAQTRRIVKLPHTNPLGQWEPTTIGGGGIYNTKGQKIPHQGAIWHTRTGDVIACPYGQPGDRLWVRETFALEHDVDGAEPPYHDGRPIKRSSEDDVDGAPLWIQPHYRATDPEPELCCERENCRICERDDYGPHWQPSIHMPRWASRVTLEITDVRVERVQDISEEDALAEGIHGVEIGSGYPNLYCALSASWSEIVESQARAHDSPRDAFRDLWEAINGLRGFGWNTNPWVWALTFKRVEQPA